MIWKIEISSEKDGQVNEYWGIAPNYRQAMSAAMEEAKTETEQKDLYTSEVKAIEEEAFMVIDYETAKELQGKESPDV